MIKVDCCCECAENETFCVGQYQNVTAKNLAFFSFHHREGWPTWDDLGVIGYWFSIRNFLT